MDPDVPLVVPEVTPHDVQKHNGIIANPNCSTIQMVHVLKPIYDEAGIVRIVVATYQSVSGAGWSAIMELESQTRDVLDGIAARPRKFPHRIAFNCIPHIGAFLDNGYTDEEMKMVHETRKILGDKKIMVSATTVRVPVVRGHGESVNVQTARKITAARARQILAATPQHRRPRRPGQRAISAPDNLPRRRPNIRGKDTRGHLDRPRAGHVDSRRQPAQGRRHQRRPNRRTTLIARKCFFFTKENTEDTE